MVDRVICHYESGRAADGYLFRPPRHRRVARQILCSATSGIPERWICLLSQHRRWSVTKLVSDFDPDRAPLHLERSDALVPSGWRANLQAGTDRQARRARPGNVCLDQQLGVFAAVSRVEDERGKIEI